MEPYYPNDPQQSPIENASLAPRPGAQNIMVYMIVNSLMVVLQLLGGWAGYTFFGNVFLGCTVILAFVCLAIVVTEKNTDFAKGRELGWWTLMPVLIGFISLGFSWYFTWICWWAMFIAMMNKKIIGDDELEQEERKKHETAPMPPLPYEDEDGEMI